MNSKNLCRYNIRAAIHGLALQMGFTPVAGYRWIYSNPPQFGCKPEKMVRFEELPDFQKDLRAIWYVEETIHKSALWNSYSKKLWLICKKQRTAPIHATCRQRMDALVWALKLPTEVAFPSHV